MKDKKTKPRYSDKNVIIAMEAPLLILFGWALIEGVISWYRMRHITAPVHGYRGEQSMDIIYYIYGAVVTFYFLLIQIAESFKGKKAVIIVLNLIMLSYLFFLSSWFRNSILFPLLIAIKRDF